MPPCEPVFQVIQSGHDGENLEKLSMETTVLNVHYVIHIIGFHVTLMRPDYRLAKVNLGRPPLARSALLGTKECNWSHVLLTSEKFEIRSFNWVRPTRYRRSTTMAASCYLCLVAVSSRRRRLHGSQSFVIAMTELKFQADRCCLGLNLSQPER